MAKSKKGVETKPRGPGRPKKGMVKVLVSMEPWRYGSLKMASMFISAIEGRPNDYSALIRDLLDDSKHWDDLVSGAMVALGLTVKKMPAELREQITERSRSAQEYGSVLRTAFMAVLHEDDAEDLSEAALRDRGLLTRFLRALDERERQRAKKAEETDRKELELKLEAELKRRKEERERAGTNVSPEVRPTASKARRKP